MDQACPSPLVIAADQFTNLPPGLSIVFSSRVNGTVLDRTGPTHAPNSILTRQALCHRSEMDYADMVYQRIIYSNAASYDVVVEVDASDTTRFKPDVTADGLFTQRPGVGLFLPVADCIATVLYDPERRLLAQLHMGRHSTRTDILSRTLRQFIDHGSKVADIQVWMAPAATKASYVLDYFEPYHEQAWQGYVDKKPDGYYLDLQGYNRAVLEAAGVLPGAITVSPINTMQDERYFSHARGDVTGRFAVIAMMV